MDMFTTKTQIIISKEFVELVGMATRGAVIPDEGTDGRIVNIHTQESGQTLFMIEFDPKESDGEAKKDTFPATVAQVQKMNKLWKKANVDAPKDAVVKATVVKVNPEPEEEINAASDDF